MEIRVLTQKDLTALLRLENEVWPKRGIESIDRTVGSRWIEEGLCLGSFAGGELTGYAYGEKIRFGPPPPYSSEIIAALASYKETRSVPQGNALHGLSMAVTRRGAGAPLLAALVDQARYESLQYFVSLARLEGLGRFIEENPELRGLDSLEVACLYAMQAVSWIDPALIGAPLSLLSLPPEFPKIRRKDSVVSRFARIGKELWGVGETSFKDPQSLGYSALLVLTL